MRMKRDYMGNDQLLPAYNIQIGVSDEYVLVYDVNQYASDNSCFIPLMKKFDAYYLKHPKYPIADAGYRTYNNYLYDGRTEEHYHCEGCKLRDKCHKSKNNRIIKINRELTSIHKEVLNNLNSTKGALLRMNRSIQVEGAFGILKQDRCYRRINRKGKDKVNLELGLIFIGYNLYKLHNKTKIY